MVICVLFSLLLFSNLSTGFYTTDQERLVVRVHSSANLEEVVGRVADASVEDTTNGVVRVPIGTVFSYLSDFSQDPEVEAAVAIEFEPTFYPELYWKKIKGQFSSYLSGDLGAIAYASMPHRIFPITDHIWELMSHTLRYFIPALCTSLGLGIGLALLSVIKPRIGLFFDKIHVFLQGLPDFLLVFLLQFGAIMIAKAADQKVFTIMQFNDDVPFLIPFLAVVILPATLVYGVLRMALQREWEESYVKTAVMKGLSHRAVVLAHLFRNTFEDLLAIFPRVVSTAIASMVIAEVMTAIFGLGGYAVNRNILFTSALPATCAILALFSVSAHVLVALLRKRYGVQTREGA